MKLRYLLFSCYCFLAIIGGPALGQPLPIPAPPPIGAENYILQDFESGRILAAFHIDEKVKPASITKIMTAYVVFNNIKHGRIDLEDKVLISEKAWRTGGSSTFLEVGTRVSVETLLKGMMIQSGNDAAVALAQYVAGTVAAFADLMNYQARKLGLTGSHFANSTGLPHKNHYMTTRDIATLSIAFIRRFPKYYNWYSWPKYTYNNITQYNRNLLLRLDPSADGIKTGHTDAAGYCLAASSKRHGMRLIAVVMGTKSSKARAKQALALLNYGFRFYNTRNLYKAGETITTVRVWQGLSQKLPLGLTADLPVTVGQGHWQSIVTTIHVPDHIMAPIDKGQKIGYVTVKINKELLAKKPLVALTAIPPGHWWQQFSDWVLSFFA